MKANDRTFRVVGPDETTSNRRDAVREISSALWLATTLLEDADACQLSPEGHVLEMLSEHTLKGWLEGYLTERNGFFSTYAAFVHVMGSRFNQHTRWLDSADDIPWRAPAASLNLPITCTVWRHHAAGRELSAPG